MKVVIVDHYYPKYLRDYYRRNPKLERLGYSDSLDHLLRERFGTSDFYSRHLNDARVETIDLISNAVPLQTKWARENNVSYNRWTIQLGPRWHRVPVFGKWLASTNGLLSILLSQIEKEKPDVLYMQDLNVIPPGSLRQLKKKVKLIVGQIACPLPSKSYLEQYDLILTSFPHYVSKFKKMGLKSEYFRIGFDPIVLNELGDLDKKYDVTFIGGISPAHSKAIVLLEYLARNTDIQFFGYGADLLPASSPIRERHHGEVWALEMYRKLAQSKITINRHIDVAENYANNMRLYEATGCGAMLLTDMKDNLGNLFRIGTEVVAYRTKEEAVEKIEYYLAHENELVNIANKGQERTLAEHTYGNRMNELVGILGKYL